MTFSCKNFDFNSENCTKLNTACIPGRPGCVLEGKVKFSEAIEEKLRDLETGTRSISVKKHRKKLTEIVFFFATSLCHIAQIVA